MENFHVGFDGTAVSFRHETFKTDTRNNDHSDPLLLLAQADKARPTSSCLIQIHGPNVDLDAFQAFREFLVRL
jgi:hypothetical protein